MSPSLVLPLLFRFHCDLRQITSTDGAPHFVICSRHFGFELTAHGATLDQALDALVHQLHEGAQKKLSALTSTTARITEDLHVLADLLSRSAETAPDAPS